MFSVVIATRDRPQLLRRALRSVCLQSLGRVEVLLVDDSSTDDLRQQHAALLSETVPNGRLITLPSRPGGSGPGRARNHGLAQATQPFVAFLDDDDEWIDPHYLKNAAGAIERLGLDLHFADQEAVLPDGSTVTGPVWTEDLAQLLPQAGLEPREGTFVVSPSQMLLSNGFAHLNTTIVRRGLVYGELGSFDEDLGYEEDRDFFLRAIDAAGVIGYTPRLVARHYVPAARESASSIGTERKEACRLRVLDKAIGSARHEAIRNRSRRDRAYTLKRMSARAAEAGRFDAAIRHGRSALQDQFGAKWLMFLASLYVRSAFSKRVQAG